MSLLCVTLCVSLTAVCRAGCRLSVSLLCVCRCLCRTVRVALRVSFFVCITWWHLPSYEKNMVLRVKACPSVCSAYVGSFGFMDTVFFLDVNKSIFTTQEKARIPHFCAKQVIAAESASNCILCSILLIQYSERFAQGPQTGLTCNFCQCFAES